MSINLPDFTHDSKTGKLLQFDGDTSLKQCNATLTWTEEYVKEYIKCRDDIEYFLENYYYITTIDQGRIKIKLRNYQKNVINQYKNNLRCVTLASRQVGKTSLSVGYILHYIIFNVDKTVGILAQDHSMALEIMSMLKDAYSNIPKWLQQGVKVWNVKSIKLENNVKVYSSATSKNALRGRTISLLLLDELSAVSATTWKNFSLSVFPTISSSKTAQILITSTARGKNQFFKIWQGANDKSDWNGYTPIRIDYWEVPGRDENWKEQALKDLDGDRRAFSQEYGNSFMESGFTLIDGKTLMGLIHSQPIKFKLELPEKYSSYLNIYEEPQENHIYSIGVDSAEMTEDSVGDAIAIQILNTSQFPFKQVATMHIREGVSYLESPEICYQLGKFYNNSTIFIEQNSTGLEIANILIGEEYNYENVYFQKQTLPGYKTNKKTKKLGCSNLKLLVENGNIILNDFDTISQLGTFIKKGTSYKADSGYKDDCVMALIASIFFMQDKEFTLENIGEINYLKSTINKVDNEEDINSIGVITELEDISDQILNIVSNEWKWIYEN